MTDQLTFDAPSRSFDLLDGYAWLDAHPKCSEFLSGRTRYINRTTGNPARINRLMEELLEHPSRYDLDLRGGKPYVCDRSLFPYIARALMERDGVQFTTRRVKSEKWTGR